jgi:hypothetical protein
MHPKLGRMLFFDPTSSYTPFGYLPHQLQDGYGLVMGPDGGELIRMPVLTPSANRLTRSAKFSLSPTGALSGDVEEVRWGELAASSRGQLLEVQPADRAKVVEGFLGSSLSHFQLKSATVGNLDKYDLALTLKYNFVADNYARQAGNLLLVRPRVIGQKGWALPAEKKRHYPVELAETSLQNDDVEIDLPAGYVVDELPPPIEAKCDYGSYSSSVEVNGSTLHYKRTYEIKDLTVPPEKLDTFREFLRQINADERQSAVLRKVGN